MADGGFETESITIPYYDDQQVFRSSITEMSPSEPVLDGFIGRHGNWAMQVNERTGLIRQGWGGSAYVGIPIDDISAVESANTFLQSEFDLLRVPIEDLILQSTTRSLNRWVVHFGQQYNSLEVFGSLVTVAISDRGNVVLFRCDYFPGIDISPVAWCAVMRRLIFPPALIQSHGMAAIIPAATLPAAFTFTSCGPGILLTPGRCCI